MEQAQIRLVSGWLLAALLGVGAFWDGLYASGQQLLAPAVLAVVVVLAGGRVALSRLEVAAVLLLAAGVALSLLDPAAAGQAAHGPAMAAGWLLALALGRICSREEWLERLLGRTWAVVAPLMVFGGLAGLSYLPAHHSGRLASFLGYPIALGLLGLLGLAGSLPLLEARRGWPAVLACAGALGVWLSGSRGVWATGVLLVAWLCWTRPALMRRAWWPVLGALAAALWAGPAVAARTSLPALIPALLACLTVGAVDWLQAQGGRLRLGAVALGLAATGAAAALAPGWPWLLGRAAALPLTDGSSVERLTFLKDGLALVRSLPLGAGYRAWTALQLQGASYGYISAEVHSSLLDVALAFGWLGAAGFDLLLVRFLWGLVREGRTWSSERLAVLAALGTMGLHALVDWELSFATFTVPLWLGFGLLAPAGRVVVPKTGLAVFAGLAGAAAIVLGAGDVAVTLSDRAIEARVPALAYQHAALASAVGPWNDAAHAAAGRALMVAGEAEAAVAPLGRARTLGPYEPWYAELQARALLSAGRWREAAAAYRDVVRLWPWHVPAYEAALDAHVEMALRADLQGNHALASDLAESARTILAALERQKAKEPPGRPRRPIDIDTPALQKARAYFGQ